MSDPIEPPGMFFDGVAALYERARSGYPAQLYDDLFAFAGLRASAGAGARVLEIGCASGQASRALAERGVELLCLEPGARLAELACSQLAAFPRVRVACTSFEDWPLENEPFDLVVAANSIQWVEPNAGVAKIARALRPGGVLALFRKLAVRSGTPLEDAIDAALPGASAFASEPARLRKERAFQDRRHFGDLREHQYESTQTCTAREYAELLATQARYQRLSPEAREAGLRRVQGAVLAAGDRITVSYVTHLLLARRKPAGFWQRRRLVALGPR